MNHKGWLIGSGGPAPDGRGPIGRARISDRRPPIRELMFYMKGSHPSRDITTSLGYLCIALSSLHHQRICTEKENRNLHAWSDLRSLASDLQLRLHPRETRFVINSATSITRTAPARTVQYIDAYEPSIHRPSLPHHQHRVHHVHQHSFSQSAAAKKSKQDIRDIEAVARLPDRTPSRHQQFRHYAAVLHIAGTSSGRHAVGVTAKQHDLMHTPQHACRVLREGQGKGFELLVHAPSQ